MGKRKWHSGVMERRRGRGKGRGKREELRYRYKILEPEIQFERFDTALTFSGVDTYGEHHLCMIKSSRNVMYTCM